MIYGKHGPYVPPPADYVVEYKRRGPFFTSPMKFAAFFSLLAILIGVVGWAVVG